MRKRVIDPTGHYTYPSLRRFLEAGDYPPGVHTVRQMGLPIDVWHDPRGFDVTTVFFHPAIGAKPMRYPVFSGQGISERMPTNRIFITDPSIYLSDELTLAWFAGNHRQYRLQGVIGNILSALIPEGQRVVTFGASGGGFAALYFATQLPNATAVPVNPQTNIARYTWASVVEYARYAWNITDGDLCAKIPAVTNLVEHHRVPRSNRVFYIQNRNDRSHVTRHLTPFMEALPAGHAVYPILLNGESGHRAPPRTQIRVVLASAVRGNSAPPSETVLARY